MRRRDDEGERERRMITTFLHCPHTPNTFSGCSGFTALLPLLHQFTSLNIHTAQGLINPTIGDGREEKMTTLSEGEMTSVSYLR